MQEDREMEVVRRAILLAYVDDIVILSESKMVLERIVKKLIGTSKITGFEIN